MPDSQQQKPAGLDFLDVIFTLTMSQGLAPEVIQRKGLLSEAWVIHRQRPTGQEAFDLVVFVLGFLTLTLSWYGYHASVSKKPLLYEKVPGMLRFVLDVALVVLYGFVLLNFKSFRTVLYLLMVIYGLYIVWDLLKIWEHWDQYGRYSFSIYRRECVTAFWFAVFFMLWVARDCLGPWCCLTAAIVSTFLYRVNKITPLWERALRVTIWPNR